MKYIVIIGDGMSDRPLSALSGKTPLQVANTPNMDKLASEGTIGIVKTIPEGFHPGSDVANLSLLGYDPSKYYSGRAPLEAASMGINLSDDDVAYRCNLVSLKFSKDREKALMDDYSAGHITTVEAQQLISSLNENLSNDEFRFYPGVSYRHLMVWHKGIKDIECVPPHDITGKPIADYLPIGNGAEFLQKLMRSSVDILISHEVNQERMRSNKKMANSIWLWGQGKKPMMPKFFDKYGVKGALISAVDLTKGLGVYAGFKIINVPGATGWIDTNYEGKAQYGLEALKDVDFLYLHIEAPDEAGHSGNIDYKIKAIEDLDAKIVGPVFEGVRKAFPSFKILITPDHPTPIEIKTHSDEPVPFIIYDNTKVKASSGRRYSEDILKDKEAVFIQNGYNLMDYFIKEVLI
ncbi:MAG: cofactor-independent phosphoglycerate mutase [Thermodesulfovibrionales bacterium]|nr:cofactor-independent phosphoglycerate mutase [Thermodesulfovibrionales bacterium]